MATTRGKYFLAGRRSDGSTACLQYTARDRAVQQMEYFEDCDLEFVGRGSVYKVATRHMGTTVMYNTDIATGTAIPTAFDGAREVHRMTTDEIRLTLDTYFSHMSISEMDSVIRQLSLAKAHSEIERQGDGFRAIVNGQIVESAIEAALALLLVESTATEEFERWLLTRLYNTGLTPWMKSANALLEGLFGRKH